MVITPHPREEADAPTTAAVTPSRAEIQEHLDVVLASNEFAASRRASELLQHLVGRSLAGDSGSLKERLLGVEIFHRRSDYNTSTDAIVRVTANDVRRRLAQFYAKNPVQPLRISLPLGSYVPDFIPAEVREPEPAFAGISSAAAEHARLDEMPHSSPSASASAVVTELTPIDGESHPVAAPGTRPGWRMYAIFALSLLLAMGAGWWTRGHVRTHGSQDEAYSFYGDLLGPIGLRSSEKSEIAITNPHVLLYHGLKSPGPALGSSPKDIPVPQDMAEVLNKTANDNQAAFPYHHFFVDMTNYTGLGEAKAAFGLARTLQATGRSAQLTEERFLNWQTARQEQLIILGAPHESAFVQETLSAANFTIEYDWIHNAHPAPGEQVNYYRTHNDEALEDYGLIWMTQSPSGTRILVLAGLSSAGTAGVGEFFSDPNRMWPVYQQLRAAAGSGPFPDSWQVLLRIEARQDVPVSVTPIAVRITRDAQR